MSFVLQTVAGILRDNGSSQYQNDISSGSYGCHKHPSRCCHRADLVTACSASFECMNDDLND